MQAMSEMYNRSIQLYCYSTGMYSFFCQCSKIFFLLSVSLIKFSFIEPINIFHTMVESDNEPIRLSYQRGSHYNSIVDPFKATIGVGLGLPSYNPGSADRALITDAVRQSEELQIEQVITNKFMYKPNLFLHNI